jgi:N6-L-threonylcarbamoyladenine synthase
MHAVDIPALPLPMPSKLAFSYAALHSNVERYIFACGGIQKLDSPTKRALAQAFQTAAVAQLEDKLLLALEWCSRKDIVIRHLVVSGGVASNLFLRKR